VGHGCGGFVFFGYVRHARHPLIMQTQMAWS
jgi:hypothetical protein